MQLMSWQRFPVSLSPSSMEFTVSDSLSTSQPVRIAIAYTSGAGHNRRVAEHVAQGASSIEDVQVDLLDVSDLSDALWETLAGADAIVFGAPTYMGGPDGRFKLFADASSKIWYDQGWNGKLAAGFTTSGHMAGDKLNTLVSFALLAAQHGMNWVSYGAKGGWDTSEGSSNDLNRLGSWLGVSAQANKDQPADIAPPLSDLRTAEYLGRHVAEATRQWVAGRKVLTGELAVAAD
jgi:NAD(P)H dehydrogenase (quinone)